MTTDHLHIIADLTQELNCYSIERGMLLADQDIADIVQKRIEQGVWGVNSEGFIVKLRSVL